METPGIDEAMVSLGSLVGLLSELPSATFRDDAFGVEQRPTTLTVEMPTELHISTDADGRVILGGAPPLYPVATTLMPVFHQLRLTIQFDDEQFLQTDGNQQSGVES